jgi:hypothetical protein
MKDQADATRVGLKFLQVGANKAALEELSKVKDAAYNDALAAFAKGGNLRYYVLCNVRHQRVLFFQLTKHTTRSRKNQGRS